MKGYRISRWTIVAKKRGLIINSWPTSRKERDCLASEYARQGFTVEVLSGVDNWNYVLVGTHRRAARGRTKHAGGK